MELTRNVIHKKKDAWTRFASQIQGVIRECGIRLKKYKKQEHTRILTKFKNLFLELASSKGNPRQLEQWKMLKETINEWELEDIKVAWLKSKQHQLIAKERGRFFFEALKNRRTKSIISCIETEDQSKLSSLDEMASYMLSFLGKVIGEEEDNSSSTKAS